MVCVTGVVLTGGGERNVHRAVRTALADVRRMTVRVTGVNEGNGDPHVLVPVVLAAIVGRMMEFAMAVHSDVGELLVGCHVPTAPTIVDSQMGCVMMAVVYQGGLGLVVTPLVLEPTVHPLTSAIRPLACVIIVHPAQLRRAQF
jgi:hypothetical protein